MVETPRVSIILPHLNEPDLLTCLRSLDRQRADGIPFEILVVDNGSTVLPEGTVSLVPGARLLSQPIPGPGPARNLGAEEAKGDLLLFIDADCIAMPGWLSRIVNYFDEHPDVDVVGGDIRIQPAKASDLTAVEAYESVYSYRARNYVERCGFAATGNMAVRADVFRKVGPFGGIGTMEDTAWGQRATALGHRIAFVEGACVKTPSCRSFAELAKRWDRHVAHEFGSIDKSRLGTARWLAKSAVMALSPLGEIPTILRSNRLETGRERRLCFTCLAQVRLYRAQRMAGLVWRDNAASMVDLWNREKR
ncbi:MAG: glycosyltransferase family 2 protein [Devosia sp.]|uniref:glycosyltransferase n=1 Tax=Devosia sp. TaxID=1871048 RepID=UPI0019E27DC0|nr:glycosyltransferase family A protein [Devosia sp.]MBF0677741.1 glycosyltransferase family 2 protein [Devosia sp.]